MKRLLFVVVVYVLILGSLYADDRLPGNDQNSNWSIQYGAGKGNPSANDTLSITNSQMLFFGSILNNPALMYLGTQKVIPKIEAYHTRFVAEYLPDSFGFQFGMNYSSFNIEYKDKTESMGALLLIQALSGPGSSTNSAAFLFPYLLISSPGNVTNFSIHAATLDFASTFHIRPRKTIDPYINLGVGFGTCGYACATGKLFGRLGTRINLGGGFIYLEGEYSEMAFRPSGSEKTIHFNALQALFGFGLYL